MSNLFDFTDTADLSADLQKRLAGGGRVNPNIATYANIVKAGKAAGLASLSISMIEAVASRMDLPEISQQAIRNALGGAVKAGLIQKNTRQTYGVIGSTDAVTVAVDPDAPTSSEAPVDVADETAPDAVDPNDPLA